MEWIELLQKIEKLEKLRNAVIVTPRRGYFVACAGRTREGLLPAHHGAALS